MVSSSNLPRHGDSIINQTSNNLGGNKFIATPQFQEFLDEIGELVNSSNQEPISSEDLIQLLTNNDSKISLIIAENNRLENQIIDNDQIINVQNSLIEQQSVQLNNINERLNDLEQLINVN